MSVVEPLHVHISILYIRTSQCLYVGDEFTTEYSIHLSAACPPIRPLRSDRLHKTWDSRSYQERMARERMTELDEFSGDTRLS